MLKINQVYHGDCLEVMNQIDDKSIDMILCDLPYGTTACKWDVIIPFEPLWNHYKRIIKDNGAIVLTATEPFASYLRMSNIKWYKYDWIWDKKSPTNYLNVKIMPMSQHELILIFSNLWPIYNCQYRNNVHLSPKKNVIFNTKQNNIYGKAGKIRNVGIGYPLSIISIPRLVNTKLHPTQKPVALFEYLIKTYTNEGDLILDNCAGSGTTGIAARNLNRDFILIEKELEYVKLIEKRLSEPYQKQLII